MSHGESIIARAQRAANESGEVIVVVDDHFAESVAERFAYCPAKAKPILFRHAEIVAVIQPEKPELVKRMAPEPLPLRSV